MWNQYRRWLLFGLMQLVLASVLLEGGVRLLRPRSPQLRALTYVPGLQTQYATAKDTSQLLAATNFGFTPGREVHGFRLNSRGFRTHEYSYDKTPRGRILALGDSFTYGAVPYDETWPVQLEDALESALGQGRGPEVVSLGIPSIGPDFYLRAWELEGIRLSPDLVVVGLYVGNDLHEAARASAKAARQQPWLYRQSLAARALRNALLLYRSGAIELSSPSLTSTEGPYGVQTGSFSANYDPTKPTFSEQRFVVSGWTRMALCRWEHREQTRSFVRQVRSILAELRDSVRSSGAELAVALIPDEFQVDAELLADVVETRNYPKDRLRLELPQRLLVEMLDRQGIPVIDLLPTLREAQLEGPQYRFRDTHLNGEGNRLFAEHLGQFLLQQALVDTGSRP